MFFKVSTEPQSNFPNNHLSRGWYVSLDEGWQQTARGDLDIWFKGYLDQGRLADEIDNILDLPSHSRLGNFCVLVVGHDSVTIKSDQLRSFPLYLQERSLGNLEISDRIFYTDTAVSIDRNFSPTREKFDIIGSIPNQTQDYEIVLDSIDKILLEKTEKFLFGISEPVKIFLSGGVDTTLIFSYIQKCTDRYQIVDCLHTDLDYFYLKNHYSLHKFWAYQQIHHWKEPSVLASGSPGDEFMCRSPITANLLLLYHNSSIPQLLDTTHRDCMHSDFFSRPGYREKWSGQTVKTDSLAEVIYECCHINANDYQHWHLGNTLTWTPLRDLEIFKLAASMPKANLIEQAMNSRLSLDLIDRNNPHLLNCVAPRKNSGNCGAGLTKILYGR